MSTIDSTHNYYLMFLSNALFVVPFIIDYISITRITWESGLSGWSMGTFIFFYVLGVAGVLAVMIVLYCGVASQLILDMESHSLIFVADNFILKDLKIPLVGSFIVEMVVIVYTFICTIVLGFLGSKYRKLGGDEDVNPA
ncbi:hypothetical protein [Listeria cornellensis]|nr:hypothetical protein [Listeria cornellensis]